MSTVINELIKWREQKTESALDGGKRKKKRTDDGTTGVARSRFGICCA